MKRTISIFTAIILLFVASLFSAEKIGYIDSEKIIYGYKGSSNLKNQYNKLVAEWENEAQDKKSAIKKLRNELENQDLMLSEETKKKKKKEIQEKEKEYEQFLKEIWGENGKLQKKHEELLKPVIEEISNIIEKIGEEDEYVIIFDISKGNIVFVKTGLDLTERVLYEINKEFTVVSPVKPETEFYVFLFENISSEAESQNLGRQISTFIRAGLNKFAKFEAVEGRRVSEAMSLLGFMKEDELDDNQILLVSRRIDADIVVFGHIDLSSGKITLKLKWINFNSGNEIIKKDFTIDERDKMEKLAGDVMTYLGREIKKK